MSITVSKRNPKRVRVMFDSVIETASGQQNVRIRDISKEGMLIETDGSLAFGENLKMSFKARVLEGTVAWQDGILAGIAFGNALDTHAWEDFSLPSLTVAMPRGYRHDRLAADDGEPVEVTPRVIRFARNSVAI